MDNPYQSPFAPSTSSPVQVAVAIPKGTGLATASLLLAICIEVLPTEADMVWGITAASGAIRDTAFSLAVLLAVKAVSLPIILGPLVAFVWINGWRGLAAVRRRTAAVGMIVGLKVLMDIVTVADWLSP